MSPVRVATYRVMVGLVASRQLARMPREAASRVRQELHALAARMPRGARGPGGRAGHEPRTLHLTVEPYVARLDIDPAEGVVTLRHVEAACEAPDAGPPVSSAP